MNNSLKFLDPIVTKLGLDGCDNIEILKGPCSKVQVRPAYAVTLLLGVSVFMIAIGIASTFLSNFLGMLYPAYMSIKALETGDGSDDKQWLTYWIVFSCITVIDSTFGFLLEMVPFYHLLKLAMFIILFHPSVNGAAYIYEKVIHPQYVRYHSEIDKKIDEYAAKAKAKISS